MKLYLLLMFTLVSLVSGCSFSKKIDSKDSAPHITVQARERNLKQTVFLPVDSVESVVKQYTREEINSSWKDGSNLLQYVLNNGSAEHLRVLINQGLSIFLISDHLDLLDYQIKKDVLDKFGRATVSLESIPFDDKKILLQEAYGVFLEQIISNIKDQSLEEAVILLRQQKADCRMVLRGLIGKHQVDSSFSLNGIVEFAGRAKCNLSSLTMPDKQFIWKSEIQRQFVNKFSSIELLKIMRSLEEMPYITSVGSSKFMFGLKTIIEVSKSCEQMPSSDTDFKSICKALDLDDEVAKIVEKELRFSANQVYEKKIDGGPESPYAELTGGHSTNAMLSPANVYESIFADTVASSHGPCSEGQSGGLSLEQGIFRIFYGQDFDHTICSSVETGEQEIIQDAGSGK